MSGDDGLRSAIRTAFMSCPSTDEPGCTHTHELGEYADAVVALPELAALRADAEKWREAEALRAAWPEFARLPADEVAALRAKAAAVDRVEAALSFTPWHVNATQMRRYIRAALDGESS